LNESELGFNTLDWERIDAIKIIACGTAYLSGVVSQYFLEPLLKMPVTVEQASEFRYRRPYLDAGTLVISISQSGETADTLASVKHSASLGCQTLSVCNTLHAAIPRASSSFLYMDAGQEIGVASTKAFVSQILCLYLWGMCFARKKALIDESELKAVVTELKRLPQYIDSAINEKEKIKELSKNYYESLNFLYIGRGLSYPLALEGALKLKEISYIHAEGYSAGELKHGPIALIDKHMPVVALVPRDRYFEKTVSNIQEIVAREGRIIAISDSLGEKLKNISDHHIYCPSSTNEVIQAILTAVPIQLFAYYIAVHRGTDVDQPRNLAKSVTVE
jgi:glucosamine--fructose-6-phosphate aminotransferase (isomerizing)